jgi:hypothetical protein
VIAVDEERETLEMLARLERASWERECKRDLTAWTLEALAPMEQEPARHHQLLLQHLEKVARGEIKRLMVLMPPGSAKSTYSSILFPPWFFAQRDNAQIIGASHGSDLAEDFSGQIQGHIRQHSGLLNYQLATENVKRWRTTNGGFYRAAGIGGSITGRRADGGLIDDPVKGAAEAESLTYREATWQWYQAEFYTRLKPHACMRTISAGVSCKPRRPAAISGSCSSFRRSAIRSMIRSSARSAPRSGLSGKTKPRLRRSARTSASTCGARSISKTPSRAAHRSSTWTRCSSTRPAASRCPTDGQRRSQSGCPTAATPSSAY